MDLILDILDSFTRMELIMRKAEEASKKLKEILEGMENAEVSQGLINE